MGRLYQTAGTATTRLAYDGLSLISEYSASNVLQRRYVHGPGSDEPLVWYEGSGTTDRRWLHADERGSIVAVSNGSGSMTAINSYDDYGNPSTSNQGRFQYTGQAWLPDLKLYYYKARIYAPDIGRFLQTDPVVYDDQINLYAYVGNDPVNRSDPTGMESPCITLSTGCGMTGFSLPSLDTVINVATVVLVGIDILDGPTPDVGAAALTARAARAERMAANAAQGAKAESGTAARLGDRVAGRRVTLESSSTGRRSVTDFITKDKGVVETKSGGSPLRPGQRDVKADIDAGRPVIPRGQNAENAGLKPGEPTKMKCYEVDRCK